MMNTIPFFLVLAIRNWLPVVRTFTFFLLLSCAPCCLGQTDTNLLATGDWSETVTDGGRAALRGRLLVYDGSSETGTNHARYARLYLELQNLQEGIWQDPIEVYFQAGWSNLHFEMRDQLDQSIDYPGQILGMIFGPPPKPFWVTLPCESTVRLRADFLQPGSGIMRPDANHHLVEIKPDGLVIDRRWIIPPNATNDFFLSATFTPPKDHPSPLNYHVWQGTLKLPKVKIPAPKP
jgi:hypothetical protein